MSFEQRLVKDAKSAQIWDEKGGFLGSLGIIYSNTISASVQLCFRRSK